MRQLAERMGSGNPSSIAAIEQNEVSGALTLRRLEAAANALDCDVAYILVPRETSLTATLKKRAHKMAQQQVNHAHRHMGLEGQGVSQSALDEQVEELAQILLLKRTRTFWDGASQ